VLCSDDTRRHNPCFLYSADSGRSESYFSDDIDDVALTFVQMILVDPTHMICFQVIMVDPTHVICVQVIMTDPTYIIYVQVIIVDPTHDLSSGDNS
jgi:hypothetical protein